MGSTGLVLYSARSTTEKLIEVDWLHGLKNNNMVIACESTKIHKYAQFVISTLSTITIHTAAIHEFMII